MENKTAVTGKHREVQLSKNFQISYDTLKMLKNIHTLVADSNRHFF